MATPRQDASHSPELEATKARQSRPTPGAFSVLAISTIVGVIVVAIIWAVFAGPFHHAPLKSRVESAQQASGFNQPPPQAKMQPTPNNTGAPNGGLINQQ